MTKNPISLTPVESSQIHSIGHDATTNTLAIRFKNSKGDASGLYHYDNFNAEDFAAFSGAESIGSYFGKNIKKSAAYPFRRIDESEAMVTEQSAPAPSRFDTSAPGITSDNSTGLVWTRAYATEGEVTFADAEAAVASLNEQGFMGFFDWRLPTVHELFGLIDHARYAPAIDTDAFESAAYDWVWTGTPLASASDDVWVVFFGYGDVNHHRRDNYAFVRAVRGPSPAGQ